jgi:hypothetical protein
MAILRIFFLCKGLSRAEELRNLRGITAESNINVRNMPEIICSRQNTPGKSKIRAVTRIGGAEEAITVALAGIPLSRGRLLATPIDRVT